MIPPNYMGFSLLQKSHTHIIEIWSFSSFLPNTTEFEPLFELLNHLPDTIRGTFHSSEVQIQWDDGIKILV